MSSGEELVNPVEDSLQTSESPIDHSSRQTSREEIECSPQVKKRKHFSTQETVLLSPTPTVLPTSTQCTLFFDMLEEDNITLPFLVDSVDYEFPGFDDELDPLENEGPYNLSSNWSLDIQNDLYRNETNSVCNGWWVQ